MEKLQKAKFTHLTILKHKNTKTSLYKLSKNHRVIALYEIFGPVRKNLQFTVFNDHPVPLLSQRFTLSKNARDGYGHYDDNNHNEDPVNRCELIMMVKLKIPFAESWNFCAATPRKEVMKTDMLDDSVSFHTNTNTHTNKYIMKTDLLNDSVS